MQAESGMKTVLRDSGFAEEDMQRSILLYEAGEMKEFIRCLRKQRCVLMDEMHESQKRIDRLDSLIRQTERKRK